MCFSGSSLSPSLIPSATKFRRIAFLISKIYSYHLHDKNLYKLKRGTLLSTINPVTWSTTVTERLSLRRFIPNVSVQK
ncbi:hypothetical protein PNOK_0495900 [Pyrrhoderma noxium]|uniref:Uncharacterized protein n=1 Tax=Pyrrhoderma noxium TaxID=2282107 RepID=A0A286UKN5_9AGAM|nr:hypothetical protein PNOK_0495900 [Pyrrhoderma noxium]